MGLNLAQERERVAQRERDRLLAQTRVVQLVLKEQFVSLHQVLGSLVRDWAVSPSGPEFSDRLTVLEQGMSGVRTLLVLDAEGNALACNRPALLGKNFSHRDYFQRVRALSSPDTLTIGVPYTTSLGVYSVNVCRMIPGPGGSFGGVMLATLDPAFFTPLMESILYAPDMWVLIAHTGGLLFLERPDGSLVGRNLAQPGTSFASHLASGRETGVFSGLSHLRGMSRIVAMATITAQGFPMDGSLVVAAARETRAIFEGWWSDLLQQAALFLVLSLFSGLGLFLHQRRKREFELQRAEAARVLDERNRFLRSIADNIPGIVGYWGRDMCCRFANRAYRDWFGRTPEEMDGIRLPDLLGPELTRSILPYVEAVLSGQSGHFERRTERPGGVVFQQVQYVPDQHQGQVLGFFVLVSDITAQKNEQFQLEAMVRERTSELDHTVQSLEQARDQLESAKRVKDAFLAAVSHELRTPLNPILGMLQLVLDTPLGQEQKEFLTHALNAAEGLHRMIDDLIDFTCLDSRQPESGPVALRTLMEVLVQTMAPGAKEKGLELKVSAGDGIIVTDLGLLRLILVNLAQNAVKFTRVGTVTMTLDLERDGEGRAFFRAEVADTGVGIAPDRLPVILRGFSQAEPYQTRHFGGIGLGLAVVSRGLQLLDGTLTAESEPGQGTRFVIRVPVEVVDSTGPEEEGEASSQG